MHASVDVVGFRIFMFYKVVKRDNKCDVHAIK